jgi:hypothetical protein
VLQGADPRSAQLQLLDSLDDRVKAGGRRRLGGEGPHQLSLYGDNKIQAPKAHVRPRDLADAMTGHLKSGNDIETRKSPYLAHQLSVFEIDTNE